MLANLQKAALYKMALGVKVGLMCVLLLGILITLVKEEYELAISFGQ